jgi:hypothetical protein
VVADWSAHQHQRFAPSRDRRSWGQTLKQRGRGHAALGREIGEEQEPEPSSSGSCFRDYAGFAASVAVAVPEEASQRLAASDRRLALRPAVLGPANAAPKDLASH